MGGLSISLLGPLNVTLDGQPVNSFEYNKVRALLGYLVVECESPHRREALAGLLWPDQSQKAALDSLRNALSKLRQAIGDREADPPYLSISKEEIQFNIHSDHWLELRRFTGLLDQCKSHRHRRIECCPTCTDRLIEAAALYRGEFMEGFFLADSNLFEDWVRIQREEYFQLAQKTLQQLASTYEWRGGWEQALTYIQRLLKLNPCHEEAYIQAMRLLGRMGNRTEACEQYEKCRKLLSSELGVEPMEVTTRLYEQIKYGFFQLSSGRFHINNLPSDLTSFVGRSRELEEINLLLEDPNCRLLSLVGPGGVGKTRLAIAATGQQIEAFPNGACFVPLVGVSSVESIVPSILQALGLKQAEQGDLKQQLVDYLKDKELVLVLDNFEHLLEGAGLVSELLEQAPHLIVLVTSRQRLGLQAEWVFEVNGLSYPTGKATQDLVAYDAVKLFQQRLHQVKPRTSLFQDDITAVSRICQIVEGLPLGIELAASAVRRRSIEQVAQAIECGKEDLRVSYKDVPERHRSIRAVFEHSYRLLSQGEQSAFIGLAVFRGGFTAEAAEQVAGAMPAVLDALVEHSLVRIDSEKERYDLHELVRQYALEKLRTQEMESTMRQRHLDFFIELGDKIYSCTFMEDGYKTFKAELDNYRTSMEWCYSYQMLDAGLQLIGAVGEIWAITSNWREVDQWIKKIFSSNIEFKHNRYLARGLKCAGEVVWYLDHDAALVLLKQALSIWQEIGDQKDIGMTLCAIGNNLFCQGKTEQTLTILEESLAIFRKIDDQVRISMILYTMSQVYYCIDYQTNLEKARELCSESLEIAQQIGNVYLIALCLFVQGNQEMNQGNFLKAHSLFEDSLSLLDNDQFPKVLQTNLLDSMGLANWYLGNYESACAYYEQGIEYANKIGDRNLVTLCNLSYLLSHSKDFDRALFILKVVFLNLEADHDVGLAIIDGVLEQLPGVLLRCGEPERTAKLYGFTDLMRGKQNASLPRYIIPDYERDLAETRRQLGEAVFNAAWEEGRLMTHEQARNCALEAKVRISKVPEAEPAG